MLIYKTNKTEKVIHESRLCELKRKRGGEAEVYLITALLINAHSFPSLCCFVFLWVSGARLEKSKKIYILYNKIQCC